MKTAYNSCMDVDLLGRLGAAPLMPVLNQIARNFPVQPQLFANAAQSPHTRDTILDLARLGTTALVALDAGADDRNPDEVAVIISTPFSIGLPTDKHYFDEALVEKYRKTVANVLSALFPQNGHNDANGVVEFEKKLAAIYPPSEDRSNITVSI
jgi:endothelin-converting enzyme